MFKVMLFGLNVLVAISLPFASQGACAAEKIAFVLGNSAYKVVPSLPNARNDAEDIALRLKQMSFLVTLLQDASAAVTRSSIQGFTQLAKDAKIIIVYYAGHGVQVSGDNYLVPTNFDGKLQSDPALSLVNIKEAIEAIQAQSKASLIVILDACRDNPFGNTANKPAAIASRSIQRGLAPIELEVGGGSNRNLMIVFATSPNSTALDGKGRNSPFTKALLKHINTPSLDLGLVMRRVTADVERETLGQQSPWVNASLSVEVILSPLSEQQCFNIGGKEYCR